MMFLLPRSEVETVDTWHISGMCGTGSWDYLIDDVFVPPERAVPFLGLLDGTAPSATQVLRRWPGGALDSR